MKNNKNERRKLHKIRAVLSSLREGVIILDRNERIVIFNEIAENLFNIKRQDVIGKNISDFDFSPDLYSLIPFIKEIKKKEDKKSCLVRTLRFKDKVYRVNLGRFVENQKYLGFCLIISDISKKIVREEKAEAIFSSVSDGLMVIDCQGKIMQINPQAIEMLSLEKQKVAGNKISEIKLGEELKKILSRINTIDISKPFMPEVDEIAIKKPTKKVLKIFTTPVLDRSQNLLGFIKTIHDITVQSEIDQMKNEFISTVSHELRTPLTAIKGFIDLILQGEAGKINKDQKEFLEIAKQNTDRLVKLISDLLDISKIESGRLRIRREPVYIDELIEKSIMTFSKEIEKKGIQLILSLDKPLPIISGDFDRLSQVLNNLISNAIKYTKDDGKIEIIAYRRENKLIIEVKDNGIGISKKDQEKLFDKFFRVDSSLTQEVGGAGLGLAITKSIISMHSGEIWVKSKLEKGSSFCFSLPIMAEELKPTVTQIKKRFIREGEKPKILVVDDEPDILRLLQIHLSKENYNVCSAKSGEEALKMAKKLKPDLITLDILLGGINGLEVLRMLKNDPKTNNIPVILLSVYPNDERIDQLGVANFLTKPINIEKLIQSIGEVINVKKEEECKLMYLVDCKEDDTKSFLKLENNIGANVKNIQSKDLLKKVGKKRKPCLIVWDISDDTHEKMKKISKLRKRSEIKDIPFLFIFDRNLIPGSKDIFDLSDFDKGIKMEKIGELSNLINKTLTIG